MPWMQRYSFNEGEVSPLLRGRPDFAKYESACSKMLNFFVHPQGGCSNRPGTRYIGEALGACRNIPFVFSRTQAYILVFSGGRMESEVEVGGYMQVVVDNGFLPIDATPGQTTRFQIDTPYKTADLPLIKYQAQVGDTMILTHEDYPAQKLVRTGTYTWTLTAAQFGPTVDPPATVSAVYSATPGSTNRTFQYVVTAFTSNGGESYASAEATVITDSPWPDGKYVTLTWDAVPGATHYNVYKNSAGLFGWIGTVSASVGIADIMNGARDITVTGPVAGTQVIDSTKRAFTAGGSCIFNEDRQLVFSASTDYRLDQGDKAKTFELSMFFRIDSFPAAPTNGQKMTLACSPGAWKVWIEYESATTAWYLKGQRNAETIMRVGTAVNTTGTATFHFMRYRFEVADYITYFQNNGSGVYTGHLATRSPTAAMTATTAMTVGGLVDGTERFKGYIDEFRILAGDPGTGTVPTSQRAPTTKTKVLIHFDGPTMLDDAIDPSGTSSPVENKEPFGGEYPGCSAIFNQRLLLGRTDNSPQTIAGSRVGDYFNFGTSVLVKDDDALTIPIASRQLAEIHHLVPLEDLVVFTGSTFFTVAGAEDRVLTPSNIMVRPKSESPCSATVPPVVVGGVIFFVPPTAAKVQGLGFDFSGGGYEERVASLLAEHLPRLHPIKEWGYARAPDSVIWCVCTDGTGLAFTYLKEHDIYAWSQITTTSGDYLHSTAVIPSATQDVPYFAVKRRVGGVDKYYIEKLETRVSTAVIGSYYMDCALAYSNATPFTSVAGLSHLAGRTVGVVANGAYIGTQTVTANAVTVPTGTTSACVGLLYDQEVEVLPPGMTAADGAQFGRTVKVGPRLRVMFSESRGGKFAPVVEGVASSYATLYGFADTGTTPYSGCKEVNIAGLPGPLAHLRIVQDAPYPITLVSVNAEYTASNS
jgi:hypothetical protein